MDSYLLLIDESEPQNQPNLWTPADMSNIYMFYSADSSDNFTFSSGTSISQWDDLSGNNHHLTDAGWTNPAEYDSTNKRILTNQTRLTTGDRRFSTDFASFFIAYGVPLSNPSESGANILLGQYNLGVAGRFYFANQNNDGISYYWFSNSPSSNLRRTSYIYSFALCNWNWLAGTSTNTYYENGTVVLSSQTLGTGTPSSLDFTVGADCSQNTRYFHGYIECIVITDEGTIASASDRQKVEGWWAHTFNHTDLLPIEHPYKDNAPTK